jgi:hypothetical protein
MSLLKRPTTMETYKELVKSALFDAEELRHSIEYDMEFMEDADGFITPLESSLRALFKSLESGDYEFSKENLPFMGIVESQNNLLLPFKPILRMINETHTRGLEENS